MTTSWAITPEALDSTLAAMARTDAKALAYDGEPAADPRAYTVADGVAVVPICGVLMNGPTWLAPVFGGTAWATVMACLDAAKADPSVRAVLLDIDSPGGEVTGMQAVGHAVQGLGKPTAAYISGRGCSAALYLAAAAGQVWASPTSIIGCVGVAIPVSRGPGETQIVSSLTPAKNRGTSTPEGAAEAQQAADDLADVMLGDMARWSGLADATAAAERFGRGATFVGTRAHTLGMVAGLAVSIPFHVFNPAGNVPAIPGGDPMAGLDPRAEAEGMPPDVAEPMAEVEAEPEVDYSALTPEERAALVEEMNAKIAEIEAIDAPAEPAAPAPNASARRAAGEAFASSLVATGKVLPANRSAWVAKYTASPDSAVVEALALKPALHTQATGDARREPAPISAVDKRTAEAGIRARAQANKTDYMTERAAAIAGNPGLRAILEARN